MLVFACDVQFCFDLTPFVWCGLLERILEEIVREEADLWWYSSERSRRVHLIMLHLGEMIAFYTELLLRVSLRQTPESDAVFAIDSFGLQKVS